MQIHREGHTLLILLALVLLGINGLLYWLEVQSWLLLGSSFASILLWGFFIQFFRSPIRKVPETPDSILSPADGKVVVIERVYEKEYFGDERIQVSIFMSPFDVHLNRVPVSGKLIYYRYHPGKYLAAYKPKSSEENEQNTIVLHNEQLGTILMRQIAGLVARRIRFYHKEGAALEKGDELGFIKFGSRMDVLLPVDARLNVNIGDQVYGGKSVLATIGQ